MSIKLSKFILITFIVIILMGIGTAFFIGKKQNEQYATNDETYKNASMLYENGNYEKAIELIMPLYLEDETNETINRLIASSAIENKDYALAAKHFQAALDRNPHNVERPIFLFNLAVSYFETQQYDRSNIIFNYISHNELETEDMPDLQQQTNTYLEKIIQVTAR